MKHHLFYGLEPLTIVLIAVVFTQAAEKGGDHVDATVHQGALEMSNASPIDEMVSMIQTQRAYETGSRVMSMISQTYQRLNNFR